MRKTTDMCYYNDQSKAHHQQLSTCELTTQAPTLLNACNAVQRAAIVFITCFQTYQRKWSWRARSVHSCCQTQCGYSWCTGSSAQPAHACVAYRCCARKETGSQQCI